MIATRPGARRNGAGDRRVLLHLGIHKTGSTSIQEAFAGYEDDRTEYLDLGNPNHSGLMNVCFSPRAKPHFFVGTTPPERQAERLASRERLRAALDGTPRSVVISAEDLWKLPTAKSCARCVRFLRKSVPQVEALAYVRAPASYARSLFQQILRREPVDLGRVNLVPPFRERGEHWAAALGRDPGYVLFHPSAFRDGDLIADFAWRAGLDPARADRSRAQANASLSAEATALLYLMRAADGPIAARGSRYVAESRLIATLRGFGRSPFALGLGFLGRQLEERAEDVAWMEERLGRPFPPEHRAGGVVFNSDGDLLALAAAQGPALREHLQAAGLGGDLATDDPLALLRAARDVETAKAPRQGVARLAAAAARRLP